jgi:hypothetical protein
MDWSPLMPPMGEPNSSEGTPNPVSETPSLEGTPGGPCGSVGTPEKICDCLECALKATNAAILDIANAIREKKEEACNVTDACIDKIWDKIKKKVEGPRYSCEQCKAMIASGAGGTIEYAVRCANVACNDCVQSCMGEGGPINDGKCCTTCGSSNCKCEGGVCKVQEEEPDGEFRGWCNTETKQVLVLKKDDPAPGPEWQPGPLSKTESVALANIQALCREEEKEPWNPPEPPAPGPVNSGSVGCNLAAYTSGQAANILNVAAVAANMASGSAQAHDAVSRLGIEGFNSGNIGSIVFGLVRSATGSDPILAQDLTPLIARSFGCQSESFTETFKAVASISQASKYLGVDASPYLTQHFYTMNAACRMGMLSADSAMAAFLANAFDYGSLDSHFAINGVCKPAMDWQLQASKSKMIPLQLAVARRRKLITEERYARGMRELGYIDESVPETLFKLTEQVPPMSDIIRYMVRDADDTAVVEKFGMDEGFTEKYGAKLREWSESQGISEDQARYSWRSHWHLPPPGALFQFYHRLRNNPQFGPPDKLLEEIKTALIQDDMLPRWIPHYLAVSFRPMRLVDIRRSFQIGSLKDNELLAKYQDLGYSDDTSQQMVDFTIRLRDRAVSNEKPVKLWLSGAITRGRAVEMLSADGIPQDVIDRALALVEPNFDKSVYARAFVRGDLSREQLIAQLGHQGVSTSASEGIANKLAYSVRTHPVLDEYEAGLVQRDDAVMTMIQHGMNGDVASNVVDKLDRHMKLQWVKQCISGIKRRFLTGELDQQQSQAELESRGVTGTRASQLVQWWGCELASGEKQASASQLCEWLSRGAITTVQFLDRLKRIGYSESDAAMMLEDCLIRANAKQVAKELKEAKERAADQARMQRILASAAKQEFAALQRLEANRKKAAKTRLSREKSLLSAAETLTDKCECSTFDALQAVKAGSTTLQSQFGLSIERSLQILNLAANEYGGGTLDEFFVIVNQMAETAIGAGLDGAEEQLPSSGSTNGVT